MDASKLLQIPSTPIEKVIIHPLVLLNVVDNYNRVSKESSLRVVGVLLGSSSKGTVDVSNSYAVPFEEDDTDPSICFLDHRYVKAMLSMFKKTNANEHVVGWYSTGSGLRVNDLDIHRVFHNYVSNPILVIINVRRCWGHATPTQAYYDIEGVKEKNAARKNQKIFVPVPSEIVADEAEDIVVENLLRDVKYTAISTLAEEVSDILTGLKGLHYKMREMHWYCCRLVWGCCPPSHDGLYHLQDVFNYLSNLNDSELIKAFTVQTNDMMLIMYLCSLIRCVIALHNLINNKILYKEYEDAEDAKALDRKLNIECLEEEVFPVESP